MQPVNRSEKQKQKQKQKKVPKIVNGINSWKCIFDRNNKTPFLINERKEYQWIKLMTRFNCCHTTFRGTLIETIVNKLPLIFISRALNFSS